MGSTSGSHALPEGALGTHNETVIPEILRSNANLEFLKQRFEKSEVPPLDDLWNQRVDYVEGECSSNKNRCRILSVFKGTASEHPVVILPGFTNYRRMYIEQAYDLIQKGYGPIYVSDFVGTGDSYKTELKPGQSEPLMRQVRKTQSKKNQKTLVSHIESITANGSASLVEDVVDSLPVGLGQITHFDIYFQDVDFVMNKAVADNPDKPLLVTGLSLAGLVLLRVLPEQEKHPTWIEHVGHIVLESPGVRSLGADSGFRRGGSVVELVAAFDILAFGSNSLVTPGKALTQFADKVLGHFNPENPVTHSARRCTLVDGMRAWAGHETVGATTAWGIQDLTHQYSLGPVDTLPLVSNSLNSKVAAIVRVLNTYQIPLSTVYSEADILADPSATSRFLRDLKKAGLKSSRECIFKTAKHQIDIESDFYRDSYIDLLSDLLSSEPSLVFGTSPGHEILNCQKLDAP